MLVPPPSSGERFSGVDSGNIKVPESGVKRVQGGKMTLGTTRVPTWRERENNKRRERRRRAIAAKIFTGLRTYGNYKIPKHCDNNEVLKAVCAEAGWIVEEDGTTYRKGCKPTERMEAAGPSASPSPCSSYQPSPCASYNPSPASSSFASPASSSYITKANTATATTTDTSSLFPWLKTLALASSTTSSPKHPTQHFHLYMHGGSMSAPVTPPPGSPTACSPRMKTGFLTFVPSSTPPSPGRQNVADSAWLAGLQMLNAGPRSPTFSLVSSNPFGFLKESKVQVSDGVSDEFVFGSSSNGNLPAPAVVKPWEGERIHDDSESDDLELTLGNSSTRSDAR